MDSKVQPTQQDSSTKEQVSTDTTEFEQDSLHTLYDTATHHPRLLNPRGIMQLQRTVGNRAVTRLLARQVATQRANGQGFIARMVATRTAGSPAIQREEEADKQKRLERERLERILDEELQALIGICEHLFTKANNMLNNLARDTKGEPVMGPLKTFDRVKEKALAKIKNEGFGITDVGEDIKDVLRATIVYEDFDALSSGYSRVYQELNKTYQVPSFVKMTEMFGTGKEAQGASGGYRDAKMVFNLDVPETLLKKVRGSMLKIPSVIPMELQFNTKSALVVKQGGKLFPQLKGFDEMNYVIPAESADQLPRFDALQFVADLITRANDSGKGDLLTIPDMQLSVRLPPEGLPKAHDLYEPEKLKLMDDADVANAELYYPMIYDLAFRVDNWTQEKGDAMSESVDKTKAKAKKSGLME